MARGIERMKRPSKLMLIVAVALIGLVVSLYTLWTWANSNLDISTTGNIIYPATLQSDQPSITWNDVLNGTTVSRTLKLTNIGDLSATLTMTWDELMGLSLIWNCTGYTLNAGNSVIAEFNLTAVNAPAGNFNFYIHIQG